MWRISPSKLEASDPEIENLISAYRPHFLRNSASIYRSSFLAQGQLAHVIINIWREEPVEGSSLVHTTFHVSQGKDLLDLNFDVPTYSHSSIKRPTPWTDILSATFGDAILDLLNVPDNAFGMLLRNVSLLPRRTICKLDPWLCHRGSRLSGLQHGDEFLERAMERLPELHSCISRANKQTLAQPATQATMDDVRSYLRVIETSCKCTGCLNNGAYQKNEICLAIVTVTITYYLWMLSPLSIEDCIYPSCTGLRVLYDRIFRVRDFRILLFDESNNLQFK